MAPAAVALLALVQGALAAVPGAELSGNQTGGPPAQAAAPSLRAPRAEVTAITDAAEGSSASAGYCDIAEQGFQRAIAAECQVKSETVTCVYAKFPQCSTDDICNMRSGCGYVQDNPLVKFTGFTCNGDIKFSIQTGITGHFSIDCNPALTPLAVGLIVVGACALLVCSGCIFYCLCCRRS